jgi:carboxymethylenebutenolidase
VTQSVYVSRPDDESLGTVLVLHEAFGVTPWLLRVCDDLADRGYTAVAPTLYEGGEVFAYDDLAGARRILGTLSMEGVLQACDGALAEVGADWSATGVVGYCIGGLLAYGVATQRACAAAVSFYGGPVDVQRLPDLSPMTELVRKVRAPWLGLYGARDTFIPVPSVQALADHLGGEGRCSSALLIYDADHGFACDDRPEVYDPEAAALSWQEMLDWFAEHLMP